MSIRASSPLVLALALSTCLLAACGGGGGNGMVQPDVAPPPPPPNGGSSAEPCPNPVTEDCVVNWDQSGDAAKEMTGGRQSDYALIKQGDGTLELGVPQGNAANPTDFRFGGGTTVESGYIDVNPGANLVSDVIIQSSAALTVTGTVTGSVENQGMLYLSDTITGDVINDGALTPGAAIDGTVIPARIDGNFSQTSNGTLDVVVGATTGGFLSVTGRADIDGTLRLVGYYDWDRGLVLPSMPASIPVLHADGGVSGQFAQWISPELFVTGSLRYLGNDVYFDATAISAAAAMARGGANALTLRSAHNFDSALIDADRWAKPDAALSAKQQQFLESAGMVQRLQDYGQAIKTFDSLSGFGYAAAADALLQQAATPAPGLIAHLGNLHAGSAAGAWSAQPVMFASGTGAFIDQRSGFDQWLGGRLLVGGSFGIANGNLQFDRSGGSARDRSPQWDFYLRRNGAADSYVLGDIGYSRHQLDFDRRIDLGVAQQAAHSMRSLDVKHAYVEAGRDFRMQQSRLTPFAALSYAAMHGGGFVEQGDTGFELVAQPSFHQRINAAAGLRLDRYWQSGDSRWTRLNFTAGYLHLLNAVDDAYAAFAGTPDVPFALAGMPRQQNTGWLQMNLRTGGENWAWLLSYDRQASEETASLGLTLKF
ncbi:MAG: autotransporter outer membrane beta-barrel domain-containing protein [Proteobacteria bacterium]|nr:autotransporter outer membrane beta-barrel domain-containing protein [Pseudomonadota bacterium]